MADGHTTYQAGREFVPEFDDVDGFKFISFEKGEEMESFVKFQHKRGAKRPLSFTTLSLTKDPESRSKKRNRKDDKRVVVDKLDGFTFVSAFTLNDFDSYDKSSAKPCRGPPVSTKRKSTTKIAELETSNKKPTKPIDSTPDNLLMTSASSIPEITLVASVSANDKVRNSLTTNKPQNEANETVSNASSNKNLSPLTKSALVRLKKINVSSLNQNKNITRSEQVKDADGSHTEHGNVNQKTISAKLENKFVNLKVPYMEINKLNLNVADTSKKPNTSPIVVSDSEDNLELDVCSIDESSSSSQFILDNLKTIEEKGSAPVEDVKLKNVEKSKPKRKPCRICCVHPCRIVGAKRIKSSENLFPSFDVSFTSTCKVHLPGEVIVDSSSAKGSVDVSIQATTTDIKMHHDFAKRFPYRVISVLSCQPRQDELNLPDVSLAENSERSSENHRILEQKRREELHGLYRGLAETLAISKIRASKLWILENALKEIRCLEAESTFLTAKLNLEKDENEMLRKRWEELSGKRYVPPEENTAHKAATKSKLLELYEKYRQDVKRELQTKPSQEEENLKSKHKETKEGRKEVCKLDIACEKSTEVFPGVCLPAIPITETKNILKSSNSLMKLSQTVSRIENNYQNTPTGSSSDTRNSISVNPNQVEHQSKDKQPLSTDQLVTAAKHTSAGPRLIVRPFQHKPVPLKSPSTPAVPKIDLTNQPETSTPELHQMLKGNLTSVKTTTNQMIQVMNSPTFKSPPPTRSSALLSAAEMHSTSSTTDQDSVLPTSTRSSVTAPNNEFVMISMMVKGRPMIFRIPKTAEGLSLLSQVSLMKRLSPESMTKIAEKFFSPSKTGQATCKATGEASSHSTVNTSQTTTPAKPTQWSTVATAQNTIASPQTTTQRDTPLGSTPNVNTCYSEVTQQQKQLIFLDVTSKENPKAKKFTVIPTSSSINVTLNKLGSITTNKVFNKSPTASKPLSNLSKASDHQILNQTIPRIILPKTVSFTNIPSSVAYTRVDNSRPPTSVHMYPAQPQIPPDPSCQLETIPKISDSLLQDAYQSDQDSMNDSGICMISNVFSLTDTTVGETSNTYDKSTEVKAAADAAMTGSTIQSSSVLGSSSSRGDGNGEWSVELIDSSTKHGYS